eukprot:jgi/Tetstr1/443582/TSEL_031581.t1
MGTRTVTVALPQIIDTQPQFPDVFGLAFGYSCLTGTTFDYPFVVDGNGEVTHIMCYASEGGYRPANLIEPLTVEFTVTDANGTESDRYAIDWDSPIKATGPGGASFDYEGSVQIPITPGVYKVQIYCTAKILTETGSILDSNEREMFSLSETAKQLASPDLWPQLTFAETEDIRTVNVYLPPVIQELDAPAPFTKQGAFDWDFETAIITDASVEFAIQNVPRTSDLDIHLVVNGARQPGQNFRVTSLGGNEYRADLFTEQSLAFNLTTLPFRETSAIGVEVSYTNPIGQSATFTKTVDFDPSDYAPYIPDPTTNELIVDVALSDAESNGLYDSVEIIVNTPAAFYNVDENTDVTLTLNDGSGGTQTVLPVSPYRPSFLKNVSNSVPGATANYRQATFILLLSDIGGTLTTPGPGVLYTLSVQVAQSNGFASTQTCNADVTSFTFNSKMQANGWLDAMGAETPVKILDLCCREQTIRKAAERVFGENNVAYTGIDINPANSPTVCASILEWDPPHDVAYDIVWAVATPYKLYP